MKKVTKRKTITPLHITIILLVVFFFILILLNVQKVRNYPSKAAVPPGTVTATLISTANVQQLSVGQTFTVNLNLTSTASESIYGTDVMLTFNPTQIKLTNVALGSSVTDGCLSSTGSPAVMAPITSETVCTFKKSDVMAKANQGGATAGTVEFGIVSFDWAKSSAAAYRPTPIPMTSGQSKTMAVMTFQTLSGGSSAIKLVGTQTSTTDTNIVNQAGDVLLEALPANGLAITIAGSGGTPVPTVPGSCTNKSQGDADCNGTVDLIDYDYYRRTVLLDRSVPPAVVADFNGDGEIGVLDGKILMQSLGFAV